MRDLLLIPLLFLTINVFSESLSTDTIYRNLSTQQADSLIDANSGNLDFIIIDVRTASEYNGGHLQNAINMNYYSATFSADLDNLDHSKIYLLYCQAGSRSGATFTLMQNKQFKEVYNMLGGISGWINAGYPVVTGTTEIAENNFSNVFSVYPNPSKENILIKGTNNNGIISIYNTIGEKLIQVENTDIVNISDLKVGAYILVAETEKGIFKKIIIKE